jgi:hypothetical protein
MMQRDRNNSLRILALVAAFFFLLIIGAFSSIFAQQPQIPTLQVCNPTRVKSTDKVLVRIESRKDTSHDGTFVVSIDPQNLIGIDANGYPVGKLIISSIDMTDSAIQGDITITSIDQVTTTGRDTPTTFLSGRCKAAKLETGGRIWMMFVDNKNVAKIKLPDFIRAQTAPDIISFLVFDKNGKRVAYGTGPVVSGNITIVGTTD